MAKSREKRTIEDALINAERLRMELPHLVQPESSCYDIINMADEIYKLRGQLENYKKYEAGMHSRPKGSPYDLSWRKGPGWVDRK